MPNPNDQELQRIEEQLRIVAKMTIPQDPDKAIVKHVIITAGGLADLVKDLRTALKGSQEPRKP